MAAPHCLANSKFIFSALANNESLGDYIGSCSCRDHVFCTE